MLDLYHKWVLIQSAFYPFSDGARSVLVSLKPIHHKKEYPDQEDEGYIKLKELYIHLKNEYKNTYDR